MISPETRASLILRLADPADDAAWSEFVEIYQPMLFHLSTRWGLQDADAGEVVQETLIAVAHAVSDFTPRRSGSFRGWLSRIARNKLADHLKRKSRQSQGSGDTDIHRWLEQQPSSGSGETRWEWEQRRQVFAWASRRVRSQVNETTWQAFYRTSVLDDSISAVAEQLQIREGRVYVARSRVLARLRKAVDSWGDGESS